MSYEFIVIIPPSIQEALHVGQTDESQRTTV